MFSVVNVYLDHLKFCVMCINSRRYVCCSECDVVSNECNDYYIIYLIVIVVHFVVLKIGILTIFASIMC